MNARITSALAGLFSLGLLVAPLAANAQSYGYGPTPYGPSSVINAWTAGVPYITPGFGNAYGAPASAYYGGYCDGYYSNCGYGGGGYNYGYGQGGYYGGGYYPTIGNTAAQFYPQGYNYQPNWGAYNQPYMPMTQTASIGSMYGGYGNGGYGYF